MSQRRLFAHHSNEIEEQSEVPYFMYNQLGLNYVKATQNEANENFPIGTTNDLLANLSKGRIRLARNVIETNSNRFLDDDDDEDDEDNEFWNNENFERNENELSNPQGAEYVEEFCGNGEEDDDDEQVNEELANILKTAQQSGYLDGSSLKENESTNEFPNAQSLTTELRMDPNYKWLLKDLNLSNKKRVIDVTSLIDLNESKKLEHANEEHLEQSEPNQETADINETDSSLKSDVDPVSEQAHQSPLFIQSNLNTEASAESESDDCKNDHRYISKLYKKLVSKDEKPSHEVIKSPKKLLNTQDSNEEKRIEKNITSDSAADEEDVGNNTINESGSVYKRWSKEYRSNQNYKIMNNDSENEELPEQNKSKNNSLKTSFKKNQFSKSFEISLEDMDNLTDRVDSGIKFKRNKRLDEDMRLKRDEPQIEKKSPKPVSPKVESTKVNEEAATNKQDVIESLKKEWSFMFNKLESDYQLKLNEQQKQNENKLKELHEEIKQSIQLQQQSFKEQQVAASQPDGFLKSTVTLETLGDSVSPNIQANTLADNNNKSISNLRHELKSKHTRHIQDLKEYYEKELEELRNQLKISQAKNNQQPNELNLDNNEKTQHMNNSHLLLNNELKNSNNALLNKLYKSGQHIRFLTQENCDLNAKVNSLDNELKGSNEKIANLENCCNQLEMQLTETIKLQNQYIRELHVEKRSLVKKMQECEELKMSNKFYEQKCESFELKLDERDSIITRLKTQLIQLETDLTRLEYEYKKSLTSKYTNSNLNQNSFGNQQDLKQQSKFQNVQQLPIKNQTLIVSTGSPSSSSSISPSSPGNHMNATSGMQFSLKNKSMSPSSNNLAYMAPSSNLASSNSSSSTNNNNNTLLSKRLSYHESTSNNHSKPNHNQLKHSESFSNPNTNNEAFQYIQENQPRHRHQEHYRTNSGNDQEEQPQPTLRKPQRHLSVSPRRFIERELAELSDQSPYSNKPNSNYNQYEQSLLKSQAKNGATFNNFFNLEPAEKKLKYIEHMEYEFDMLMKHKQQLDAQLTRLPYKATNTTMQNLRHTVESELEMVEKKLSSVKLELRKLNIIKSH